MVDTDPDDLPSYDRPLIEQKHHGMISGYYDPFRKDTDSYNVLYARHYHNQPFGEYLDGRHHVISDNVTNLFNLFTLKYKYSPWNKNITNRLHSYECKLNENDSNSKIHLEEEQNSIHKHFLTTAHDLTENISFKEAYDYCMRLQ
jgi:hypothetical protein